MSNQGVEGTTAYQIHSEGGHAMNGPNKTDTIERDEELIGILFAISVVSKRLARSLQRLAEYEKGGNATDGKDVGTLSASR